jgi:hypothetical protein
MLLNSFGRPVLLTALSEVSGEARGAVLGLNITGASVGWLAATSIGGPIIIGAGYGGLGLFAASVGFIGAALALASRTGRCGAGAAGLHAGLSGGDWRGDTLFPTRMVGYRHKPVEAWSQRLW